MKRLNFIAITSLVLALAASCNKSTLENTYISQESLIEGIVKNLSGENTTTDYLNGSVRVTTAQGEGEALEKNGAVSFYYAGYRISSKSLSANDLFATNHEEFASSVKWNITDTTLLEIKTIDLSKDDIVEGLRNGLPGVKAGDECYVLFSGKHGFGKHSTGNVPANSALAYRLWIKGVSNK